MKHNSDKKLPWTVMHPDASQKKFASHKEASEHVRNEVDCTQCAYTVNSESCSINLIAQFPEIDEQYLLY